jgi:hypothetical protein
MAPRKPVWGEIVDGEIVLLSATVIQIMHRTGQSKALATTFHEGGIAGVPRDETHPPGGTSLAAAVIDQVLTKAVTESLADVMH